MIQHATKLGIVTEQHIIWQHFCRLIKCWFWVECHGQGVTCIASDKQNQCMKQQYKLSSCNSAVTVPSDLGAEARVPSATSSVLSTVRA
jgi:hypothetical protein